MSATTIRPLVPELNNNVPPDQGARRGWLFVATSAGSLDQRDRIKLTLTIEHITSGIGYEVGGTA